MYISPAHKVALVKFTFAQRYRYDNTMFSFIPLLKMPSEGLAVICKYYTFTLCM